MIKIYINVMKYIVRLINKFTINASMWIGNIEYKYNIKSRLLDYIAYRLSKFYITAFIRSNYILNDNKELPMEQNVVQVEINK